MVHAGRMAGTDNPDESGVEMTSLTKLAEVASGRDHIRTSEFARAVNKTAQTIRKNYCLTGECFGVRPIKIGNALLWPVSGIAELLSGRAIVPAQATSSSQEEV